MRPALHLVLLPALLATTLIGCGKDAGEEAPRGASPVAASPATEAAPPATETIARGRALLLSVQEPDGSFGDPTVGLPPSVGFTAMAAAALAGSQPREEVVRDEALRKALQHLASLQQPDGSVYHPSNPRFVNYETSAAVAAFSLSRLAAFAGPAVRARDWLAASQYGGPEDDPRHGGFPYAARRPQPPDLSNLQFAAEALALAELPPDHEAWKRMRVYLSRVQNRSESNALSLEVEEAGESVTVRSGDDGGAFYGPGMSKAGLVKRSDGTYEPRSYGSMTYALLKCLLLAGVEPSDPRVQAALGWIARNFTVERNPGFEAAADPAREGMRGYYYYLFTMARALGLHEQGAGKPLAVRDAQGRPRAWRRELIDRLVALQREDGGWRNEHAEDWDEGSRTLSTAYALLALAHATGRLP
jgi:hypothetical protein